MRRWIPVLKLMAGIAVLYVLTIHWWFTAPMLALGEQRHALIESQRSMQQEIRQRDQLQGRLAQLEQSSPGLEIWMSGDSGTVSAQLGQKLDTWMHASPVTCQSITRTPAAEQRSGRFRKTLLQVRLRCSMQGLVALMARVESESPAIFIENLELATRRHMASVDGQNTGMDVTMDIAVYSRMTSGAK